MAEMLDLRGLSCPIPLLKTKEALASASSVTVVVDELPPKENILKFAKSQEYSVTLSEHGDEFHITIKKP